MIFNLPSRKKWKRSLPEHVQNLCVIQFLPNNDKQIIAGTKDGKLLTISIETQSLAVNEENLNGSIKSISFSSISSENSKQYMLAATKNKAILFDIHTLKMIKTFEYSDNYASIKEIDFVPIHLSSQQQIFAHLSDDSIIIWSNLLNLDAESSTKQLYYPLEMKRKYLETHEPIDLNVNAKSNDVDKDKSNQLLKAVTKNYSNGRMKCVTFSSFTKELCISTIDGSLLIFNCNKNDWKLDKVYVTSCMFISQCIFICPTPLSCTFLVCVTGDSDIILLYLGSPILKIVIQESLTKHIVVSSNSLMLGATLSDGECLIYNLADIVMEYETKLVKVRRKSNCDKQIVSNKQLFDTQITQQTISRQRLVRILNELNVYPTKYRTIIWQTLLNLPKNGTEFGLLVNKGLHSCTDDYEKQYPWIHASEMRKLKCISSFLAHWCKVSQFLLYNFKNKIK